MGCYYRKTVSIDGETIIHSCYVIVFPSSFNFSFVIHNSPFSKSNYIAVRKIEIS